MSAAAVTPAEAAARDALAASRGGDRLPARTLRGSDVAPRVLKALATAERKARRCKPGSTAEESSLEADVASLLPLSAPLAVTASPAAAAELREDFIDSLVALDRQLALLAQSTSRRLLSSHVKAYLAVVRAIAATAAVSLPPRRDTAAEVAQCLSEAAGTEHVRSEGGCCELEALLSRSALVEWGTD